MWTESDLEQSLTRLKPAAEKTILKDVKMSRQLEDRILDKIQVQSEDDTVQRPVGSKGHLWTFVAFAIAVATTFAAFGLLHSTKTTRQTITALTVSVSSVAPAVGLATLLNKDNLRIGAYRLHAMSDSYSST